MYDVMMMRWPCGVEKGCFDVLDVSRQWNLPPCIVMRRMLESCAFSLGLRGNKHVSAVLKRPDILLSDVREDRVRDMLETLVVGQKEGIDVHKIDAELLAPKVFLERLVGDVERCVKHDYVSSPASDAVRQRVGEEFEDVLYRCLKEHDVSFWTEADLRDQGFHKTPDARLKVPIAIDGKVVCWIDSKATFCEERNHKCVF